MPGDYTRRREGAQTAGVGQTVQAPGMGSWARRGQGPVKWNGEGLNAQKPPRSGGSVRGMTGFTHVLDSDGFLDPFDSRFEVFNPA